MLTWAANSGRKASEVADLFDRGHHAGLRLSPRAAGTLQPSLHSGSVHPGSGWAFLSGRGGSSPSLGCRGVEAQAPGRGRAGSPGTPGRGHRYPPRTVDSTRKKTRHAGGFSSGTACSAHLSPASEESKHSETESQQTQGRWFGDGDGFLQVNRVAHRQVNHIASCGQRIGNR